MSSTTSKIWYKLVDLNGNSYIVDDVDDIECPQVANINDFRKLVKEKCSNVLANVDAIQLIPYKNQAALDAKKRLRKSTTVGSLLTSEDDPLLIVVCDQKDQNAGLEEAWMAELRNIIEQMPAPNEYGKSAKSLRSILNRTNYFFRIGRYESTTVSLPPLVPISLLFPLFGEFQRECRNPPQGPYPLAFLNAFHDLSRAMSVLYDSEKHRQHMFFALYNKMFELKLDPTAFGKTDASLRIAVSQSNSLPLMIVEFKNEIGSSGDPLPQLAAYYATIIKECPPLLQRSCILPIVAMSVFGQNIEVYTAVFTTVIQFELVFTMKFTDIEQGPDTIYKKIALLRNLDVFLLKLKQWYLNTPSTTPVPVTSRTIFEMPALPDSWNEHLKLCRFIDNDTKMIFRANPRFGSSTVLPTVVKFTQFYNVSVHAKMAELNMAPKLHRIEKMSSGYYVVEMELLEGYDPLTVEHLRIPGVTDRLQEILNALRSHDFVHADFRYKNLMISLNSDGTLGDLKLIDFDLSGINEKDIYPDQLNPDIDWHPTVQIHGKLLFDHDLHFFNKMKRGEKMVRLHSLGQYDPPTQEMLGVKAFFTSSQLSDSRKRRFSDTETSL